MKIDNFERTKLRYFLKTSCLTCSHYQKDANEKFIYEIDGSQEKCSVHRKSILLNGWHTLQNQKINLKLSTII